MQRQRGELVPIDEIIGGLSGPVQAIREASPQARRGFTLGDQVNQLVGASEADPDRGFMARTMALCSLPRHFQPRLPECRHHGVPVAHGPGLGCGVWRGISETF